MDEHKRIGALLLDAGVITADQLSEALAVQKRSGGRLCQNLISLGHLRPDDLVGFLREHFGVDVIPGRAQAGDGVLNLDEEGEAAHPASGSQLPGRISADDWLRRFILMAVRRRSREIHLESLEEGLCSRYRVRGVLQDGDRAPPELRGVIVRRALGLAGVPAGGCGSAPGEGRFRIQVRGRWLLATLSAFPTLLGERIVLKIVEESRLTPGFQELGMSKEVADEAQRLLGFRHGVLFVNAPPGQGRHTTFYSFLARLKEEGGRNVMALESQVRFTVAGISQSLVGSSSGLTFAGGLQAILHQEPDVIGIADVTDRSTLEMVFAAGRSCFVVALCAFRDNRQALEWIRDSGIGTATLGLILRGVLAQRLLPKICSSCREPLAEPVHLIEGIRGRRVEELTFYAGNGCQQCGGTGSAGRVGIFELLSFREDLRGRLLRGDPSQVLVEEAQRQGMWSLREDGILKASQGLVDIREVLEATAEEGSQQP